MKGPIPEDIWVLHECDNYKCINIDHLFLGTAQDNTNDMIAKGRKIDDLELGERRKVSTGKLLGTLHAKGMSKREITNHLGISYTTVWSYFNGPNRAYLAIPSGD